MRDLAGRDTDNIPTSIYDGGRLAFTWSGLVGLAFPRRAVKPGTREFIRETRRADLHIHSGRLPTTDGSRGGFAPIPSGVQSRFAMLSLQTRAVQQRNRKVDIGSFGSWVKELGFALNGKNVRLLAQQMAYLAVCRVQVFPKDKFGRRLPAVINGELFDFLEVAPEESKAQPSLFPTTIVLSEKFYTRLIDAPIPVPRDAVLSLRRASHVDLYLLLVKMVASLNHEYLLTWEDLHQRIGTPGTSVHTFSENVRKALPIVLGAYDRALLGGYIDVAYREGILVRPGWGATLPAGTIPPGHLAI